MQRLKLFRKGAALLTAATISFSFIRKVRFQFQNKKWNSVITIPLQTNLSIFRGFNWKWWTTTIWAFHLIRFFSFLNSFFPISFSDISRRTFIKRFLNDG